ncbi:Co2+/Mg2+ efflux protein ApaG [Aliiglaciecola sp. CAU 1673]|uniref:Co2+/Mg2+ efflux protein ApaG n=1 Tax=Aliiglaciecola sp. CAU 1673 TaxID=3032595 RepID=UPI0023DA6F26|nr:Co2+/Mg2+ efflux protein ApaG [Aliiglaciecola sp. CAU 1673]MDF2176777.1 Co2+/Mg2+ efflux protein ApaG [Aliiglaciecola sp. CAU 1673]
MSEADIKQAIKVEVETNFLPGSSTRDKFAFAYHITIKNQGDEGVQLLSRYWLITDGNGNKMEVSGEGVVGKQPVIMPGENYQYSSGAMLETPVGTMQGFYTMERLDGGQFNAAIPIFSLAVPHLVN